MFNLSKEEEEMILQMRKENSEKRLQDHPITRLHQYIIQQKVEQFDILYKMALDHYTDVKENGCRDDDTKQWMFQAVMELLGKNVWKTYNEYLR